jgi:hypothetical protein
VTDEPLARVADALAAASRGLAEHAEVWRSAVERNAAGEYAADDALADWQTLWGLALRDAATVWAALFDALEEARPEPPPG